MRRNVAGQQLEVFAFNRSTAVPVEGDAANISGQLRKDSGSFNPLTNQPPTESEAGGGHYFFDIEQEESNASFYSWLIESSTAGVQVIVVGELRNSINDTGSGTGARIVTLTFEDEDSNPLASVRVRLTNGASSFTISTGIDGIATFNVDDGAWSVSATKSGYQFTTTLLTVDGNETATYEMTTSVPSSPSLPGLCTVRFQIYASNGATPISGATVNAYLDKNTAIDGILLSNAVHSGTTDNNGICDLVLVQRDSIIKGKQFYHIVATDGVSTLLDIRARVPNQNYTFAEDLIFEG